MISAQLKVNDSKSLELKYTASRAEQLEAELDDGLLAGLTKLDRVSVMIKYISHGAGISPDEARAAFDEIMERGGSMEEISDAIVEALKNGGYISKSAVEAAKNLRGKLLRNAPQS